MNSEAVAAAAGIYGNVTVRYLGPSGTVDVVVTFDHDELRRRAGVALEPILDRSLLKFLQELGKARALDDVDPVALAVAADEFESLVCVRGEVVSRTYRPPLQVQGVVAVSADPDAAIRRVGVFADDGRRVVGLRRVKQEALEEARRFGIGVVMTDTSAVLVEPGAVQVAEDAVHWRMCEELLLVARDEGLVPEWTSKP